MIFARLATLFLAGILLATVPPARAAEEEHAHEPRRGGYFGDADDIYHYELLRQNGARLILYVNDEENKPLDVRRLQGRWILDPDGPSPPAGFFIPSEDGSYFFSHLPDRARKLEDLHVKVEVLKEEEETENLLGE